MSAEPARPGVHADAAKRPAAIPVVGVPVTPTSSGAPLPSTPAATPTTKGPLPRQDSMKLASQRGISRHDPSPSPSPEVVPAGSPRKGPLPRQDSMKLASQRGMSRHDPSPSPSPEVVPADSPISSLDASFQVTLHTGPVGIELSGAAPPHVAGLSPSGSAKMAGVTMGAQVIRFGDVDLRDKSAGECTALINSASPPIVLTLLRPGSPASSPSAMTSRKLLQTPNAMGNTTGNTAGLAGLAGVAEAAIATSFARPISNSGRSSARSSARATAKAEVFLVHNFVDPSDELPDEEMGLRISPRSVEILEPESREVVKQWDWDDVQYFDGYADDWDPSAMDMLILRVMNLREESTDFLEYRFELEDHKIVIAALERAQRSSGVMRRAAQKVMLRRQESARRAQIGECSDAGSMATSVEDLQTGEKRAKPKENQLPKLPFFLIVFTVFFGVGVMVPVLKEQKSNGSGEAVPWTMVDGFYYSVQTMTTVGYGDLTPTTRLGRIVVMMYLFFAVGFIGVAIRSLHVWYTEVQRAKKAAQRRLKLRQLATVHLGSGQLGLAPNAELRREMRQMQKEAAEFSRKTRNLRRLCCCSRSTMRLAWAMVMAAVPVFALGFSYSVALYFLDDIDYLDAVYIAVATGAAVGYGDYSPRTQGARLVSIFVIPVFVLMTIGTVGKMVKIAHSRAHTNTSVKGLLKTRGIDDEITLPEFQVHMLKAWKKVSVDDLETIENMFQSLDASGDGVLNAEDISEQRDHRASMMMMQAGASGRSKMRV